MLSRLALLVALLPCVACSLPSVVILPDLGKIQGVEVNNHINAFYGIPYAEAPVGELRWTLPSAKQSWGSEVLNATDPRVLPCIQPTYDTKERVSGAIGVEDCLKLNVWAPSKKGKFPVMFWIHGGSYLVGGISKPVYSGQQLVELSQHSVVVVTIQYRLGVFGFLGAEQLRHRTLNGSTGNFGIQDQRAAMEWVKKHIKHFNGDPDRVFVFGESAGAGSISNHLVMPNSFGLFHSVAMESGSFSLWESQPFQDAQTQYNELLEVTHCRTNSTRLALTNATQDEAEEACLLTLPAPLLSVQSMKLTFKRTHCKFAPTVDNVELENLPSILVRKGDFNKHVNVIQGFNKDEGTMDVAQIGVTPQINQMEASKLIKALFGFKDKEVQEFFEVYKSEKSLGSTSKTYWQIVRYLTDSGFACPAFDSAYDIITHTKERLFLYEFVHVPVLAHPNWAGWSGVNGSSGVFHSAELPFVFHQKSLLTKQELELSNLVAGNWIQFAIHGRPKGDWNRFDALGQYVVFGSEDNDDVVHKKFTFDSRRRRCEFVKRINDRKRGFLKLPQGASVA